MRSRVVLSDDVGGVLAARAFFTLDYLGHGDQVALLDGGLKTWKAESRRISKEEYPPVAPGEFSPHVRPDVLVSTAQMRQPGVSVPAKGASDYAYYSMQAPAAEHTGLVYSGIHLPRQGHIAGSQSLQVLEEVDSL